MNLDTANAVLRDMQLELEVTPRRWPGGGPEIWCVGFGGGYDCNVGFRLSDMGKGVGAGVRYGNLRNGNGRGMPLPFLQ